MNLKKSELHPTQRFDFIEYHFLAQQGACQTSGDIQQGEQDLCFECMDFDVHHWITSIYREDTEVRQDSNLTFSVASETSLKTPDASEFSCTLDSKNETTQGMVVRPPSYLTGKIVTPQGAQPSQIYRCLKFRLHGVLTQIKTPWEDYGLIKKKGFT